MSESRLWTELNNGFGSEWDAERVDNRITPGYPDVSYGMHGVNGHIELKCLQRWPKNGTIYLERAFGEQFAAQRRWLIRRGIKGGHCFLLVWIKSPMTWLLFDHIALGRLAFGAMSVDHFRGIAIAEWRDWINWPQLTRLLIKVP